MPERFRVICFQYLERRFSIHVRRFAVLLFMGQTVSPCFAKEFSVSQTNERVWLHRHSASALFTQWSRWSFTFFFQKNYTLHWSTLWSSLWSLTLCSIHFSVRPRSGLSGPNAFSPAPFSDSFQLCYLGLVLYATSLAVNVGQCYHYLVIGKEMNLWVWILNHYEWATLHWDVFQQHVHIYGVIGYEWFCLTLPLFAVLGPKYPSWMSLVVMCFVCIFYAGLVRRTSENWTFLPSFFCCFWLRFLLKWLTGNKWTWIDFFLMQVELEYCTQHSGLCERKKTKRSGMLIGQTWLSLARVMMHPVNCVLTFGLLCREVSERSYGRMSFRCLSSSVVCWQWASRGRWSLVESRTCSTSRKTPPTWRSRSECIMLMGAARITSWHPNFNGSHFGLPPSSIHEMTGLGGKMVWTMTYAHRPYFVLLPQMCLFTFPVCICFIVLLPVSVLCTHRYSRCLLLFPFSFSLDPSPGVTSTVWSTIIGNFFLTLPLWGVNQISVQRYLAATSLKQAKMSVWNIVCVCVCVSEKNER